MVGALAVKLITASELAKELNVSQTTIWRMWKNGIIPRIRGTSYYDLNQVEKALNEKSEFNPLRRKN